MLFESLENRQLFSHAPIMTTGAITAPDAGGNSPAEATGGTLVVGQKHVVADAIGAGDTDDFYRITVDQNVVLKASLKAAKGKAELTLVNADGTAVGQGKLKSVKGNLEAGDYFLKVHSPQDSAAAYKLSFNAKASKRPGNSLLPGGKFQTKEPITQTGPGDTLPVGPQLPPPEGGLEFHPKLSSQEALSVEKQSGPAKESVQSYRTTAGSVFQMSTLNFQGGQFRAAANNTLVISAPTVNSGTTGTVAWIPAIYRYDPTTGWSEPMYVKDASGNLDWTFGTVTADGQHMAWTTKSYMTSQQSANPNPMMGPANYASVDANISVGQAGIYAVRNWVYSYTTGEMKSELSWSNPVTASQGTGTSYYTYVQ